MKHLRRFNENIDELEKTIYDIYNIAVDNPAINHSIHETPPTFYGADGSTPPHYYLTMESSLGYKEMCSISLDICNRIENEDIKVDVKIVGSVGHPDHKTDLIKVDKYIKVSDLQSPNNHLSEWAPMSRMFFQRSLRKETGSGIGAKIDSTRLFIRIDRILIISTPNIDKKGRILF